MGKVPRHLGVQETEALSTYQKASYICTHNIFVVKWIHLQVFSGVLRPFLWAHFELFVIIPN